MCYIGDSTGLYFYSAVFQGNMALLAFVGVFVVFRLQALSNHLLNLDSRIMDYVLNVFRLRHTQPVPLRVRNAGEVRIALQDIAAWRATNPANAHFAQTAEDLRADWWLEETVGIYQRLLQQRGQIARGWIIPAIAIALVCFLSQYLLTVADGIHKYCPCSEAVLFGVVIVLNITAVVLTIVYGINSLKPIDDQTRPQPATRTDQTVAH